MRAGSPAAIVTTSGTAVANLFPAVVEASMSGVPMVVLSADRPGELRASGANQTIDQVKLFGSYVRHTHDLLPPGPHSAGSAALTAVDAAVRFATASADPGPVHLNCQLREPLAPALAPLSPALAAPLATWEASRLPFTLSAAVPAAAVGSEAAAQPGPALAHALRVLAGASRGTVLAGQLRSGADRVAALRVARLLGWPVVADMLSGLRAAPAAAGVILHVDTLLTDEALHEHLRPDCVLQIGAPFVSKRVSQFLASCAAGGVSGPGASAMPWLLATPRPQRLDEHHCITAHLQLDAPALAAMLAAVQHDAPPAPQQQRAALAAYRSRLTMLDAAAGTALHHQVLAPAGPRPVTEPAAAMTVAANLPDGHGLFVGSSMPIRDLDMYGQLPGRLGLTAPVACNRGASGIDGVVSCAAGFAAGLQRPATLLVGDVSFLHDANGLLTLQNQQRDVPLTIVLINNSGGGIFHFLPIHASVEKGAHCATLACNHALLVRLCGSLLHRLRNT
jgi:2-succinyl-5-enolpyruvyl-6-hydroxy-3-cyclohexene-1-carboxylate synthase